MKYIILTSLLASFPALAETMLSPQEFEALSTGKTLYFSKDGEPYGAEQFFKGRRSKWRYSDGICENGEWFASNNMICFIYENAVETQCWDFFETESGGYAARAEGAPLDEILELDFIDTKPLLCKADGLAV